MPWYDWWGPSTPTTSSGTYSAITTPMWSPTSAATTLTNPVWSSVFIDQGTGTVYTSSQTAWAANANLYQQQAAYYDAAMLHQQQYRPHGLGQLFAPSRPAIITHQEAARREQELYRRAIAEHDEQEAARLLRQIEARERAIGEQRRLMEQQRAEAHERQVQFEAARTVARDLLLSHLTPQQRQTFDANGWFIIEGGRTKTKYRINTRGGCAGNIDVLRGHNDQMTHRLCCHAPSHIPMGDQWLSQKIMLELAEDDFLRIANSTRVA